MPLMQPPRTERSKRQLKRKIVRVTAEARKRAVEREDSLYVRIKAGEVCPICQKDYDVSVKEHCICGVNDDWREDEPVKEGEQNG